MKYDKLIERALVALERQAAASEAIAKHLAALRDAGYIMERGVSAQQRTARAIESMPDATLNQSYGR